jgi:hypothetical protein
VLPEEGLDPGSFTRTVAVGFNNEDNTDEDDDDDEEEEDDDDDNPEFFCSRLGDVLVACGETFRLSACLPGTQQPAPDVQHLYSLHKARCYSPAAGCMVLGSTQSLGGLRLVQQDSAGSAGKAPGHRTLQIQAPEGQDVTCCALSPDGAWLLLGTDGGEVRLARVPKRSAGAPAPAPPAAPGDASGRAAPAAVRSSTVAPRLLGRHDDEVAYCAFHPSSAYVATCR